MPYGSAKEVPSNVPSGKKRQFMEVFNSVYDKTKDEGRAMAAAYSAIKKAQYASDIFTTEMEARARSMDLGLEGEIHVHEYDGQAVYMPGESHSAYLEHYEPEEEDDHLEEAEAPSEGDSQPDDLRVDRIEALRAIVQEVLKEDFQKAEYICTSAPFDAK